MDDYHYTECGLDNVYIGGMDVLIDDHGDEVYAIPNINGLHKVIAHAIVNQQSGMGGKELRFLRTEIGMTQAELAKLVHCDAQTVGRWERGETPIQPAADVIVRTLVLEKLGLAQHESIEELSERCVPSATIEIIKIDGRIPGQYKIAA